MTPFDDFVYLINHVLLGEEPTIEDFILLVGTLVAFIAFILWCCFPIQPKKHEPGQHRQFTCKIITSHIQAFDKATNTENNATASSNASSSATATANATNIGKNIGGHFAHMGNFGSLAGHMAAGHINNNNINNNNNNNNMGNIGSAFIFRGVSNLSPNSQYNTGGTYSKSGTVAMHNYYVKSGHHCCT